VAELSSHRLDATTIDVRQRRANYQGTADVSPASKWRFGRPPHTSRSFSDGGALTSCRYAIWTGGIRFLLAGLVSHC
jgi:hypothetical protein